MDRRRRVRRAIGRVPLLGSLARTFWAKAHDVRFHDSGAYWEARYATGGTSGEGSYGRLALWKAETINRIVAERRVASLIEFGSGDGAQLALANYPRYIGIDVAPSAIRLCIARFRGDSTKSFFTIDPQAMADPLGVLRAELALSLDVLYHLVEDEVREAYLTRLFDAAERIVIIYSTNGPVPSSGAHERHREFTTWVRAHQPEWRLLSRIANPYGPGLGDGGDISRADFFVYERAISPHADL